MLAVLNRRKFAARAPGGLRADLRTFRTGAAVWEDWWVGGRAEVVWRVARDPQLLRIQTSFCGFAFAEHSTWLAILVFAYQRGGVGEAGLVSAIQLAPATVVAPFAAYAGDRFRPERVLASGYLAQAVSMLATAVAMWADRPLAAYAAAAVAATCVTFSRPVMGAILPIVARTPNDLVAANVVTGLTEYIGMFVGPLLTAIVLAQSSPATAFAICAAVVTGSALLSSRLTLVNDGLDRGAPTDAGSVISELFAGVRALGEHATVRVLVLMVAAGAATRGVVDVLMVTFAESRLDGGGGSAGVLGAGLGVGAVLGALVAAGLIGRSRLLPYLLVSAVLASAPYLALSGIDLLVPATMMFFAFGMAESLLRVTTDVGIQRGAPDRVLARIFGVCEGLQMAMMAVGSVFLSVLVGAFGLDTAIVVIAIATVVTLGFGGAWFRRLGGDVPPPPEHVVERLRIDPVFAYIGGPALARLGDRVEHVTAAPGEVVIAEGQQGDRYYLIVDGRVSVSIGGIEVRTMGAGESFGEIALLRDVVRQATVTANTELELLAVSRDDFLSTVTGHPRSLATATEIADRFTTHFTSDDERG
jgi:MFS family permease